MEQELSFHLPGVIRSKEEMADFEGPLTLILMLLSRNKVEIRDIQIAQILEQYLDYLDRMKEMDLEIASEFVQMAAHLLYIKTRMLLSADAETPGELELLMASLEQLRARDVYAAVQSIAPAFARRIALGSAYCCKPPEPLPTVRAYRYHHAPWELLNALSTALRRGRSAEDETEEAAGQTRRLIPKRIVYPVRDKSRELLLRLAAGGRIPIRQIYRESASRSELVAGFLSILELCSLGHTRMEEADGVMFLRFCGGNAAEIVAAMTQGEGGV